jgi:hypothetical protein
MPVRHVIISITTPACKVAKFALVTLKNFVDLKNGFNTINSVIFANRLINFTLKSYYEFITLDTKDLCINIFIN